MRRKKMQVREKVGKSRFAGDVEPSGQMRDEKLHSVVVRSTFRSQNVQSTACSDHFGSSDVEKCTPLSREAHIQIKSVKN